MKISKPTEVATQAVYKNPDNVVKKFRGNKKLVAVNSAIQENKSEIVLQVKFKDLRSDEQMDQIRNMKGVRIEPKPANLEEITKEAERKSGRDYDTQFTDTANYRPWGGPA